MLKEAIRRVVERIDLEEDEMSEVVEKMMDGTATPSQVSALLIGLRMKGESIPEITGAAKVMINKSKRIVSRHDTVVDLCGTGGDQQMTFNVSTVASFITAGAGIPVAKHGNRSVSSQSGSADVLEELGVDIDISPAGAENCLNEVGIAFLFAPVYHPAMKFVAQTRKEIGVRSIFNILGPITNPAGVKHQVMGVYSGVLLQPMAKVLRNLGCVRSMVVHGFDSLDEITVTGKTEVAELKDGMVRLYQFDPADLGFKRRKLEELRGGNAVENARILLSILKGEEKEAKRDICVLNTAAALVVAGKANDMKEGAALAEESIDSGKAMEKLNSLIKFSVSWKQN